MPTTTELRQNAEAKFKRRELERVDGRAALVEYAAANQATIEKTARLRALRLSRDTVAAPAEAKPKASPKAKPKAKPSGKGRKRAKAD